MGAPATFLSEKPSNEGRANRSPRARENIPTLSILHVMSVLDFSKPVTQRDIARALGVSVATVSLALRNRPVLAESTRREIQEFAVRAGYRLDEAAAELSGRKRSPTNPAITENIAWVTTSAEETLISRESLDDCRAGAETAAKNLGYRLEEFELSPGINPARLHQILRARGIRCMLLSSQSEALDWMDFPWECYSVARFGQSMLLPNFHSVSPDHVGNAMKAFRTILSRGYRRIGFLSHDTSMEDCGSRWIEAGFLAAQRFVEEENRIPIHLIPEGSNQAGSIAKWVKKHRVEVILTDLSEAPVLLENAGLRAPEDIGLAMMNVRGLPIFSGINPHPEEIGKAGVHLLHSLITDNERGTTETPRQLLVNGAWTDGPSLPRLQSVGETSSVP
jgi:LacI family transcriptional regulator